ncbi:hypothetical protein C2I06_14040 [Niallia circulans]|uniref:hypothetical protein n=1 Tax=Niallia circulans TaxID=1397 RepID=UPI000F4500BA|nr:hypothetical protein [Niallia circulans]AYV67899.1 hypothetical protein C2I06_14040 [Niallia circulans]
MQISNKTQLSNVTTNEKQLELLKNETYNAQIKSRISETEAVVQIKGKDFNVKFEETIPKENRVSVQISDMDGGEIKVKTNTTKTPDLPSNPSSEKMIEDMSISEKSKNELRMATAILGKKTTINRDILVQLNAFLEDETGTIDEKLVSIRALASKNLEISAVNLRSIHAAVNGEPLNDIITKIANAIDPNFQKNLSENQVEHHNTVYALKNETSSKPNNALSKLISELSSSIETEADIQKGIELLRTKISENPRISKEHIKSITQAIQDSEKLQSIAKTKIMDVLTNIKTGNLQESATELNKVKDQIKQESNLQKAIQTVKETIVNNPKMPPEVVKQVEQAVREATISQRLGQESAGREKLVQAITKAEQEVTAQQAKPIATDKAVQDQLNQTKDQIKQESNLQKAIQTVKETIVNNPKMPPEVVKQVEQAVREATISQRLGQESAGREKLVQAITKAEQEVTAQQTKPISTDQSKAVQDQLNQTKDQIKQEPNLQKAIQTVKETIINNPKMPPEVVKQVEQAVREATISQRLGQESAGREKLVQAITKAEQEVTAQQTKPISTDQSKAVQDQLTQTKDQIKQEPNLQKAIQTVKETITNNPKMPPEVVKQVEQAVREATISQRLGQESAGREKLVQAITKAEQEVTAQQTKPISTDQSKAVQDQLNQTKDQIKQEPNLQKAIQTVKETIVNNPKMPPEVVKQVEQAVREATISQRLGQESAGREKLVQAITKAEQEVTAQPSKPIDQGKAVQNQLTQTKDQIKQEPNLQKAIQTVKETIVNNPKMPPEVVKQVEQAVREATISQRLGQESAGREKLVQALTRAEQEVTAQPSKPIDQGKAVQDQLNQTKDQIKQEPNLQKAIQTVKETIVNNPKMPPEVVKQVEQAVREATISQRLGQESAGREKLVQAITKAEQEVTAQQTKPISTDQSKAVQDQLNQTKEQIKQEPNLQKAIQTVKETIINNPKMPPEVVKQVEQAVREATISQRLGQESAGREKLVQAITKAEQEVTAQPSKPISTDQSKAVQDQLNQTKDQIKQEPNLQKAIQTVKETIVNNPKMPPEVVKQVEQAVREATISQRLGQESAGREKLVQALTKAEQEITAQQTKPISTDQSKAVQDQLNQTKDQIKQEPNLQKAIQTVKETITNNPKMPPEVVKQVEQILNQADQLNVASKERIKTALNQVIDMDNAKIPNEKSPVQQNESNREAARANATTQLQLDSIKQAVKQIQKEPILEKALHDLKSELRKNENLSPDKKEKIEKAINTSLELSSKGREMASRQNISKALQEVETAIQQENKNYVEDSSPKQVEMEEKRWDSQLQAMGISSKDILVTKISQKLAEATHEFRDIKREIYRNLDNAQKLMEKYKDSSIPQASKIIESTIAKLDQTILKSDLMLYADMRTEKRLLQASSQLAEAKKYLSNGNTAKATEIVSEVKKMVESIQYKPSEQKIVHYVSKNSALLEEVSPLKSLVKQSEDMGRNYILEGEEPSSRQMYEKIRSFGLNRESDVANKLVSSHTPTKEQEDNLKTTLLKLASSENLGDETVSRQAEQALNNINGQQLLNKQDSSSQLQSMFFNLPMLLGEKNENIQVFINSKSKGEQVDWENCNLYFLLETKKLGDVGILLNATDRNLSITVKNDLADFEKKMSPLSKIAVDRLQEIGYQVQNIQFTHLTNPSAEAIEKKENKRLASVNEFIQEKGVNLQI